MRCLVSSLALLLVFVTPTFAQTTPRVTKVAVLNFGVTPIGKRVADKLRTNLHSRQNIYLLDPDLSSTAARGIGYSGSLNMTVNDARDLGATMDAEFYVIGDAQTLRRSSSKAPVYYESYSSLFLISSRTGRLVFWDHRKSESDSPESAEQKLIEVVGTDEQTERLVMMLQQTLAAESNQRLLDLTSTAPLIEEAPEDDKIASSQGLRLPRPYRRLRPAYPDSAARAEVEATVDVLVDVGADGEVGQVQVARWAGFGLDETTIATVRQLHFFPAMRNGNPIPMRVLLRYNFRKSSQ